MITHLAQRPANDSDASELAAGVVPTFSAWTVESQSNEQLLLRDFSGRSRSWLMVSPDSGDTDLYFGAAAARIRSA